MLDNPKINDRCPNCDLADIEERQEEQEFAYGVGSEQVLLKATVPVFVCPSCEFAYSDERGEISRHAAVCSHLGVLSPSQIIAIRENVRLGRREFAELTGVGIASLQRWETGSQIQSRSNDNLIRLMSEPANLSLLSCKEGRCGAASQAEASIEYRRRGCSRPRATFPRLAHKPRIKAMARDWRLRRTDD